MTTSCDRPTRIALMGASFSTGNLGVSALAHGALTGIFARDAEAVVTVISGAAKKPDVITVAVDDRPRDIEILPIRYGRNILTANHVLVMYVLCMLATILPIKRVSRRIVSLSRTLAALWEADVVADLSGGDSFTDIYGMRRMVIQTLFKCLVLFAGKPLVLLPQTIGPFNRPLSKTLARFILRRAAVVYTRDLEGIEEARRTARSDMKDRLAFAPDVGFLMKSSPPDAALAERFRMLSKSHTLIGINVSGLLMSGGYTGSDQFGLNADYLGLHVEMVRAFLRNEDVFVMVVPHVITAGAWKMEDDVDACETVVSRLSEDERVRVLIVKDNPGAAGVKYLIGQCSFFVGSRMHSCIAALSQGVPAVGIAYSRKFRGVFETLGVGSLVLDVRSLATDVILRHIALEFARRDETAATVQGNLPKIARDLTGVFETLCGLGEAT